MTEYDEFDEYGDEIEYYAVRPNKTQLKKEIAGLFDLAETLSKLTQAQLSAFELPDNLHKAITDVSGMPHIGARKRSLKYIASQFHKMDMTSIQERLARLQNKSAHSVREHHIIENWRDRLIHEGNEALTELVDEQPTADLQQIRQLIRNVKKEAQTNNPPKSSRLLYRYLKTLFQFDADSEQEEQDTDF